MSDPINNYNSSAQHVLPHGADSLDLGDNRRALTGAPTPELDPGIGVQTGRQPSVIVSEPTVRERPGNGDGGDEVRITLWGGSGTGKTTLLAALPFAVSRAHEDPRYGTWSMTPNDDFTAAFSEKLTNTLNAQRRFPQPSDAVTSGLSWTLRGHIGGASFGSKRGILRRATPHSERMKFVLQVPDVPGEAFLGSTMDGDSKFTAAELSGFREILLTTLAASDAFVYLFDPVPRAEANNSFQYLHGMLGMLQVRLRDQPRYLDQYLPHRVAVCVTKFDDPKIHTLAKELRMLGQDRFGQPAVPPEQAGAFFEAVCDRGGSDRHVLDKLRETFAKDRLHYFATSAVGFKPNADRRGYDPDDPYNINAAVAGQAEIVDVIRPINVFEPIVTVGQQVLRGRR